MEKKFNEIDALKVIRQSIEQTKESFREKGSAYLIVGWFVFLTAVFNSFLIMFTSYKDTEPIWVVLMLSQIFLALYALGKAGFKGILNQNTFHKPQNYLLTVFSWILLIVLIRMDHLGVEAYPIIIIIFGAVAFGTGGILHYKPLIIGGSLCLFLAMFSNFFKIEYRLLFLAAALLSAFIIPGHLLRASK